MLEDIEIPHVYNPIFPAPEGTRHIALFGGRGSAKSHTACIKLLTDVVSRIQSGKTPVKVVGIRESQKSIEHSVKGLIESYLSKLGLYDLGFKSLHDRILFPGDSGFMIFSGMRDYNSYNIKSLEDFDICWAEEADAIGGESIKMLRPTIRKPGSYFIWTWNPKNKLDAVEKVFRSGSPPKGSILIEAQYYDNPHFTEELKAEMEDCRENDPENFDHIWLGQYKNTVVGAYFARQLLEARRDRRVNLSIPDNSLYPVHVSCDLGVNDLFVMWVSQWIGREVLLLDCYAATGQSYSDHIGWLMNEGYTPDRTWIHLPHDGKTRQSEGSRIMTPKKYFEAAGYRSTKLDNEGSGAAMKRISRVRELFPCMSFSRKCSDAVLVLGQYKPKFERLTGRDLGPDHASGSDYADALGLLATVYKPPKVYNPDKEGVNGALKRPRRQSIA